MNWRAHYLLCAEEAAAAARLSSLTATRIAADPFLSAEHRAELAVKYRGFAADERKRVALYEGLANDIA